MAIEVVMRVIVATIANSLVSIIDPKNAIYWFKGVGGSYILGQHAVLRQLLFSLEPVVYLFDDEVLDV